MYLNIGVFGLKKNILARSLLTRYVMKCGRDTNEFKEENEHEDHHTQLRLSRHICEMVMKY